MIFTNRIQLYNKKDIHDKVGLILKMYAWLNINVKTCNFSAECLQDRNYMKLL